MSYIACRCSPAAGRSAQSRSSPPSRAGSTRPPISASRRTWPPARRSPSRTRGSTGSATKPTGSRTSSSAPCPTSCARRSTRSSATPHAAQRHPRMPPRQARALEIIERNAQALTQIIEDVLDVSRIISGKLRLNMQPVDLAGVVETPWARYCRPPMPRACGSERPRPRRAAGLRRSGPAAAGGLEPAVERRQVHAARRHGAGAAGARRRPGARSSSATPDAASRGFPPARVRALPAGRQPLLPQARRPRPGSGHRPRAGRAARRHGRGGERGEG